MKNLKLRQTAKENGVHLWQIAERVGLADCNFSRKLRRELSDDERERVLAIIQEIVAEKGEDYATNEDA